MPRVFGRSSLPTLTRLAPTRKLRAGLLAGFVALGGLAASAAPRTSDLMAYFDKVHALYPEAEITGRFYDWRAISQYRSHAGLHLGYDIALNAGRAVPAGWPGHVVDIIPWTDNEWGVCVETSNGYRVTYGHIAPAASIGQTVSPGQTVGNIVHDHVDIKVRDASGGYFDFGQSFGILDATSPWASTAARAGLLPPPPDEGGLVRSAAAPNLDALYSRYRDLCNRLESCRTNARQTRQLIESLRTYISNESVGLPEAEQQMVAWYRAADNHAITPEQLQAIELQVDARRKRVNHLVHVLEARMRLLSDREAAVKESEALAQEGLKALTSANADSTRIRDIEAKAAQSHTEILAHDANDELARKMRQARERLQTLEQGLTGQTALSEAKRELQRLQMAEVLWKQGDKEAARDLIY
jgi:hypothetical protein